VCIACIIAYEWQQDGYLKPGKIARVYRDSSLPTHYSRTLTESES
jgi:hypothetical protein